MRLKEIEQRLAAIKEDIEKRAAELTAEELAGYETEVKDLQEERTKLLEQQEKRAKLLTSLANNDIVDTTNGTIPTVVQNFGEKRTAENPTDTKEYRTAFMNFACRGTAMPLEMRTGENTTVADTGAVIPNTIMQEIIVKMESYGNLYAGFTKLNIQGGVAIPIADIKPVAKWVGEESGEDQKLGASNSIVFNYYGIEVKISQSILANVVTLEMFQKLFIPLATEAIVKGIEVAAINGKGSSENKLLGVTKDTRVTNVVTLTEKEISSWSGWHKNVKKKIKKAYRDGIFILNQSTFDSYIDGMVDSNGQPIARVNYGINGEESYRFMGRTVETVESDVLPDYDDANDGDVIGIYMKLSDYVFNSSAVNSAALFSMSSLLPVSARFLSSSLFSSLLSLLLLLASSLLLS
jgi:HK97 family phage major capsid protein